MERWVIYRNYFNAFAGFTSVVAKQGLVGISAELGLTVRTIFVCIFVLVFAVLVVDPAEIKSLRKVITHGLHFLLSLRQAHGFSITKP